MTRLTRLVLVALTLTSAVALPGGAAAASEGMGSIGLRLVDVPLADRDDPRAQIYIVDHLAPGTTIHRRIEVSNTSALTTHIELYPAAATIQSGVFLGAAGRTPNDLSTWTSVFPRASDVLPAGRAMATVTIVVPNDAAPGEQYGVVWAEVRSAAVSGVIEVNRVGIRLYVSVASGGQPAADFTIDSITASRSPAGRPIVSAMVRNTGGRALDMSGTLRLSNGPGSLSAGPFPATLGITLAIGDTEPIRIALDERLPAGPWDARITVRSGVLERTARATITFPVAGASVVVKTISTQRGWPYLVVSGLLLASISVFLHARRRRTRRPSDPVLDARSDRLAA